MRTALVAGVVERRAHLLDDAAAARRAGRCPPGALSTSASLVSRRTPHSRSPSASATSKRGAHRVVTKSTSTVTFNLVAVAVGELRRRAHRVAAVGGDEPVRDGAHAAPAPPRGLRVGREPIAPATWAAQPVAGLHRQWSWRRGEEEDLLAVGRLDDLGDVCASPACAAPGAQARRSPGGEQRVVAANGHHDLARPDAIALVEPWGTLEGRVQRSRPDATGPTSALARATRAAMAIASSIRQPESFVACTGRHADDATVPVVTVSLSTYPSRAPYMV